MREDERRKRMRWKYRIRTITKKEKALMERLKEASAKHERGFYYRGNFDNGGRAKQR